jgi:hypothetical protein
VKFMSALLKPLGLWIAVVSLLGVTGCAKGLPAVPPGMDIEPPTPPPVVLCGNMKLDLGEQCDCPNHNTTGNCAIPGMTCDMIMPGMMGPVLCQATTCLFSTALCTGGPGGTGAGGTGHK